jgi:hypothetical protein
MIIATGTLTQITESLWLDAPVSTIGCHRLKWQFFLSRFKRLHLILTRFDYSGVTTLHIMSIFSSLLMSSMRLVFIWFLRYKPAQSLILSLWWLKWLHVIGRLMRKCTISLRQRILSFVFVCHIRPSTLSELTDVYADDGNKGKNKLILYGRWIVKQPVTVLAIFDRARIKLL